MIFLTSIFHESVGTVVPALEDCCKIKLCCKIADLKLFTYILYVHYLYFCMLIVKEPWRTIDI